jgi:hypothetical protein
MTKDVDTSFPSDLLHSQARLRLALFPHAARECLSRAVIAMEDGMEALEHLSIMVAMLLAMAAALVSSDREARQEVIGFLAEALKPQTADLGVDPGISPK